MTATLQDFPVEVQEACGDNPALTALAPFYGVLSARIGAYQAAKAKHAALSGDRRAAFRQWVESTEDPEAVELREAIAAAQKRLQELAAATLGDGAASQAEKKIAETKLSEATKEVKTSGKTLSDMVGLMGVKPEELNGLLKALNYPFVKSATAHKGTPRPSVLVKATNANGTFSFDTMSASCKTLDTDVETLGKAYADAAGVAYEEIAKVETPTTFQWTHPTRNTTWTLEFTPKETKPRGRQAVAAKDPQEI